MKPLIIDYTQSTLRPTSNVYSEANEVRASHQHHNSDLATQHRRSIRRPDRLRTSTPNKLEFHVKTT